jgi:hypothetical protein
VSRGRVGHTMRHGLGCGLLLIASCLTGCEGKGSGGDGLIVRPEPTPECSSTGGFFPSGLTLLSPDVGLSTLVQFGPPGLAVYEFDALEARPVRTAFTNIGTDSDGDGLDDQVGSEALFPCRIFCETQSGGVRPVVGALNAIDDRMAFLSTSDYEQVLTFDPSTATPVSLTVDVPATIPLGQFPLLPTPGSSEIRRGISTFVCVEPPNAIDSNGDPVGPDARCNPDVPSYLTSFTAGSTVAGDRLFVSTSNFVVSGSKFRPGTVLVYDWIDQAGQITVRPLELDAVLFTSGFNPTGLARHVTASGRELVLVTVTGAIIGASVPGSARSEAAIDVIDPSGPRIIATIPLGFAAPSFEPVAIDATEQIAWIGSVTSKQLYAIDLRGLDDPLLYVDNRDPVVLDGLSIGFPDARIFFADDPLVLPPRLDRSPGPACGGWTYVTTNERGTEAYATDYCDGTLSRIRFDLSGPSPIPFSQDRFQVVGQTTPFAPTPSPGERTAPGFVSVRPGIPAIDYESPDVFVLVGDPGLICGIRVESL